MTSDMFRKRNSEFDEYARNYVNELDHPVRRLVDRKGEYFIQLKCDELMDVVSRSEKPAVDQCMLDIGSGLGFFEAYLADRFDKLFGLDLSLEMLRVARDLVPLNAGGYVCGDATRLALPDSSVDVVMTSCVFHHMPNELIVPALREMVRVCRPGGHVIVFEHNPFNPVTQLVVRTTPLDHNAILIRSSTIRKAFTEVGIHQIERKYILFGPKLVDRFLRRYLGAIHTLPFGGQYYVSGIKK